MEIKQGRVENGAAGGTSQIIKATVKKASLYSMRFRTLWCETSHTTAWEFSRCGVEALTLWRESQHCSVNWPLQMQ